MKRTVYFIQASLISTILVVLAFSCARPCPKDIDLGDLNFFPATNIRFPASQLVEKITFKQIETGQLMEMINTSGSTSVGRFALPVETLCERGDFLDKTSQVAYFNAQSIHLDYYAPGNTYSLSIGAQINNAGPYGSRTDTLFYEVFSVYGQKLTGTTRTGSISLLASDRGNTLPLELILRETDVVTVADTTLGGRHIVNALVTPNYGTHTLYIFYTIANGIEAFTMAGETWVRQ